ncbi:hypothetical protein HH212_07175 [Massilia forsythiae]|uniref:Uncharacterized protein n=1 Tax=Massilia forsythiae TaxID=2728020 RepID=A0A7Z2ZRV6_9BURK|nr:hypothetical protein [Massilia forsythiae]QJD99830.1 hypothetical protein HH212_07175 [Massilia forsythiae]
MADKDYDVVFGAEYTSPARRSVVAELQLLKECCNNLSGIEEPLRALLLDKLKSQGGLASLEWKERSIVNMSLNTHKSAAGDVIVGGFKTIDVYRKAALEKLQEHLVLSTRPTRGTIAWHKTESQAKSDENDLLIDEIMLLTGRLGSVMDYARELASKANKSEEFLALQSELLRRFPIRSK